MSPSCSARASGMPWQMTSLTDVQHALREAVVVERAGVGAALDVQLVDEDVDLVGGDAGRAPARRRGAGPRRRARRRRRIRSMISGDLTRGSFQRSGMPVVGVRRPGDGRPAPLRIGLTSPGSTRPSRGLWHRLYLRPLPHQHRSLERRAMVGVAIGLQVTGWGRTAGRRGRPGLDQAPPAVDHSPWWPMPHPQWSGRPKDQRVAGPCGLSARWQTVRSAVLSLTQRGGRRTTFGATFPMRRSSLTY